MADAFNRAKLSAAERNFRSRNAQLASNQWFLRGTLSERSGKCGKPTCQICVPLAWQSRIRRAVTDYQQMQKLIEEVSELEWTRLRDKKE
jgi:hypothetical protein